MAPSVRLFFRIVYATFYTLLHILLVVLLLVTPGDIINQSRKRHDIIPILIVSACYVAAILVVLFVYSLRIFLGRAVLNSIPKSWIPIDKGDVRNPVRKMIAAGLSRSAAIAFVSRPRILPDELFDGMCPMLAAGAVMSGGVAGGPAPAGKPAAGVQDAEAHGAADAALIPGVDEADKARKAVRFKKTETVEKEKELGIALPPCFAVWGTIEHPGWAPPDQAVALARARRGSGGGGGGGGGGGFGLARPGGPAGPLDESVTLQYSTVVAELPNLIEAKALTLAPLDPASQADPPLLDADAVMLLQRPAHMGLREYLAHLAGLGVVDTAATAAGVVAPDGDARPLRDVVSSFVATYEYARFSTQMLTHAAFRQLMHDLATILRRMAPLDPALLLDDGDDGDYEKSTYSYSDTVDGGSGRPYFTEDSDAGGGEDAEDDDIDNNAARSSPTTPPRSRTRSGGARAHLRQPRRHPQTYAPITRDTSPGSTSSGSSSSSSSQAARAPRVRRARPDALRDGRTASSASSSANSFAQTRHPYMLSSQPSSASLRSTASSGSVIRLADRAEQQLLGLPYRILPPEASQQDDHRF